MSISLVIQIVKYDATVKLDTEPRHFQVIASPTLGLIVTSRYSKSVERIGMSQKLQKNYEIMFYE